MALRHDTRAGCRSSEDHRSRAGGTVYLLAAAAELRRGIAALLHGACKLFARKRYLRRPKGAAAFLPFAAIACSKPVFIMDAASAFMLYATVIQLISVAAFLLQLMYVLRTPWQAAEGFAAMSPPAAPHPCPHTCSTVDLGAWKGSRRRAAPDDHAGVPRGARDFLGCACLHQSEGARGYFARLLENSC